MSKIIEDLPFYLSDNSIVKGTSEKTLTRSRKNLQFSRCKVKLFSVAKRCCLQYLTLLCCVWQKAFLARSKNRKTEIDAILVRRRQSFFRQPRYHFS
jgi:predicted nucleic acid binding AN1-type Zn finger protein